MALEGGKMCIVGIVDLLSLSSRGIRRSVSSGFHGVRSIFWLSRWKLSNHLKRTDEIEISRTHSEGRLCPHEHNFSFVK